VKRVVVLGTHRTVHQEIAATLGRGRAGRDHGGGDGDDQPRADDQPKDIARQARATPSASHIKEVLDRVHWNRARQPASFRSATRHCSTRSFSAARHAGREAGIVPSRCRGTRSSPPSDHAQECTLARGIAPRRIR